MNAKCDVGYTALMVSAWVLKGADVAKVLIEAGANVNARNKDGETVLRMVNKNAAFSYNKDKKNLFLKMLKAAGAKK